MRKCLFWIIERCERETAIVARVYHRFFGRLAAASGRDRVLSRSPNGPRDRATFGVSAHSCDAPCRWTAVTAMPIVTSASVAEVDQPKCMHRPSARPLPACSRARACRGVAWKRRNRREVTAPASLRQPLRAAAECDRGPGRRNGLPDRTKKLTTASTGHTVPGTSRWLPQNCSRVRGAFWVRLTNFCRKPTLFFHEFTILHNLPP